VNAHKPKSSRKISLSLTDAHSHGSLSYLELGQCDAPAVVFIHGFGADLLTWQFCLLPLASRFRIIALDLPGHGRSSPDVGSATLEFMTGWLDEAFTVLGIRDAHIVGHSMGGKIALGYVLAHPERVLSLSLISPAGLGNEYHHDTLDAYLSANTLAEAENLAQRLVGPIGQALRPSLSRSLHEAIADPLRAQSLEALLGNAKAYGLALSPEGFDWSRVRCPLQILWGDHDQLIPLPEVHRLPQSAPFHIIAGAGHLPHMEADSIVVQHLKEFLCPPSI
jgi:pimeloyl-ACP methyl ester carboxylesterase